MFYLCLFSLHCTICFLIIGFLFMCFDVFSLHYTLLRVFYIYFHFLDSCLCFFFSLHCTLGHLLYISFHFTVHFMCFIFVFSLPRILFMCFLCVFFSHFNVLLFVYFIFVFNLMYRLYACSCGLYLCFCITGFLFMCFICVFSLHWTLVCVFYIYFRFTVQLHCEYLVPPRTYIAFKLCYCML